LLQDCSTKLSEAVSRSNWDKAKVVQILMDTLTKDSKKIAKDRIRIQEQKDEVERQKVVAASSGVKRGHAKSTEEAASTSTAKRMKPATPAVQT